MLKVFKTVFKTYIQPFLAAIFPVCQDFKEGDENTREFLRHIIEILLDFITDTNNRDSKVVDFYHPDKLKEKLDLEIPEKPLSLDQLLEDCRDTLKYQVKTGKMHYKIKAFIKRTTTV